MKGISAVISTILLLMITIAMVGFVFVWFSRITGIATNSTETELRSALEQAQKKIAIEAIDPVNSAVAIKNIGTVTVLRSEIQVYVNNTPKSCGWTPPGAGINPGQKSDCTWTPAPCPAGTTVRATAPGNFDQAVC